MRRRPRRSTLVLAMSAALCGGSLFTSCVTRLNLAAVDGSKNFFFEFLNQAAFDLIEDLADTTEE